MPQFPLSTRLLYIIATLPFLLLAILYFSGAFEGKASPKPSNPTSATPTASPTDSLDSPHHDSTALPSDQRIDTARQHPPGKNAADFYKQAYGLYKQLSQEEKVQLSSSESNPEETAALLAKIRPIVELLRQGKDAAYCDWGLDSVDLGQQWPQMEAISGLALVLDWSAGQLFRTSSPQAIADLRLEIALGNSVGSNALSGFFVNLVTAQMAFGTIADHLGDLDVTTTPDIWHILQQASWRNTFSAAIKQEADWVQRESNAYADPNSPKSKVLLARVSAADLKVYPEYLKTMSAGLAGQAEMENQLAQNALAPAPEFESWWQHIQQQVASNPWAKIVLPVFAEAREMLIFTEIKRTMLQAGLAIFQGGDAALAKFPDPSTGAPFQLVPTANGFELHSTFQSKGKPVVMPFPTPKP